MDRKKYRRTVALMSLLSESKTIDNADIATFDGNGENLLSLIVGIEPVQDLHGYDAPWPAGGGKNLADMISDGYVPSITNGALVPYDGARSQYIKVNPNTTYTASFEYDHFNVVVQYDTDKGFIRADSEVSTVTTTATTGYVMLRCDFQTGVAAIPKCQLELGSTATAWSPYSNICPISGWTGANVVRTGKNLLDDTHFIDTLSFNGVTLTKVSDGHFKISGTVTSTTWMFIMDNSSPNYNIPVSLPVGTYTLSCGSDKIQCYIFFDDGFTKNVYARSKVTSIGRAIKGVRFLLTDGSSFDNEDIYLQLEIGSTDYEPYFGDTYPITFPSEAGTVYGGTLNVTSGKLYVNRVLHAFNGEEPFILLTATDRYSRRFGVKLSSISGLPPVLTDDVICSHGVQKISTDANLYDFVAANDYISFYDYDGVYSTVSAFKANLAERYNSGNPVQACFYLKDPIVYDVDPVAIKTLVGQNNIWADTGKIIFLEYES